MDARFTAGRLSHREARLCHQMMPPGSPDPLPGGPPVAPPAPNVMRPPVGPPGPMMTARVGGAADAQQQLLASNFLRESQDFMARFNDIPRRFAGRPDLMQAEMQQAIQGANRELLMRHQQSGGNYPLYVIQPTPQGLVAFMQTPRGPMPIPLGGPQMPPGMTGSAVPGMPGSMAMIPGGGVMRPSMIPGRPGSIDYPPQPAGPEMVAFVRGLYLSRNPDRMTPQMRTLWQQTIIGGLELLGAVTPSSLNAVIGTPPTEQLTIAGTRMQPLFRVIGAVRLIGVALAYDRIRGGRTGPGDIPPVDVNAAINTVNNDPGRLVQVDVARGPDNRITSVKMTPRPQADLPAGRTAISQAELTARLRAELGPTATLRPDGGGVAIDNPTPEQMQGVIRVLQTMTTAEIVPPATSEARINTYKDNPRRKVNVARQPATGTLTRYELTPRTDIPAADRITFEALQKAMIDEGLPATALARDGTMLTIRGDGLTGANLLKVANVLDRLVTGGTAPGVAPERAEVERLRVNANNGVMYLVASHNAVVNVDTGAPPGGAGVVNVASIVRNPALFDTVTTGMPATAVATLRAKLADPSAWDVKVVESGQTLDFRYKQGKWEFKATGAVWKNVTEAVVAADVGTSAPIALHFNTNVLPTLRDLATTPPNTMRQRIETVNRVQNGGMNYLMTAHGAVVEVDFGAPVGRKNVTSVLRNSSAASVTAFLAGPPVVPPASVSGVMQKIFDPNFQEVKVAESGQTLEMRFRAGKWEFKATGGTWKNATEAVAPADVGASAPVAGHFNTNVLPTLRELNGGSPDAALARIENLQKSQERGLQYMRSIHGAVDGAAGPPQEYNITESGQTLNLRSNRGKWEFKAAGGTWKAVTEAVVPADVGASAPVAGHFNTNVLPTLRELDGPSPAAAQTRIENLQKSQERGLQYMRSIHGAADVLPATTPPSYRITESGQNLEFRSNRGKWEFKAAGGTWKAVTEAVVAADVGASAPVAGHFNTNVLPTLRELDGASPAAAQTRIENLQKSQERGLQYMRSIHGAVDGAAGPPQEYNITESGQTLNLRSNRGKWEFKAAGGTWKAVTEAVVPADVGASAPVAGHFNTNVLPTLRELDGASPAAAQTRIETLEKNRQDGVDYIRLRHDGAEVTPATTPPSYRIAESGQNMDFRYNRGKWEFKAAGGTWKAVTEAVVPADVGASAPIAAHFNTNVLPTLRAFNTPT